MNRVSRSIGVGIIFSWLSLSGIAQELNWTELNWANPSSHPETMPTGARMPAPEVPAAWTKSPTFEYAYRELFIDPKGHLASNIAASTSPWLQKLATTLETPRFKPATDRGEKVWGHLKTFLLFNPSTSCGEAPTTPRLLQPAIVPISPGELPIEANRSVPVSAILQIDGTLTDLAVIGERGEGVIELALEAAKGFRFAPALKDGKPQPSPVQFAVLFVLRSDAAYTNAKVDHPAQARKLERPVYPKSLKSSGISGEVVLRYEITAQGRAENIALVSATHPLFVEPATTAVEQWQFNPAIREGLPVRTRVEQSIQFRLEDEAENLGTSIEQRRRQRDGLPPEFRYDSPPVVRNLTRPVHPSSKLDGPQSETVRLVFIVGPHGRVLQSQVLNPKDPEFDAAALACLDAYQFTPATRDGAPCLAALTTDIVFDLRAETKLSDSERALRREMKRGNVELASARTLDSKLKPLQVHPALFPTGLLETHKTGTAEVEFIIDQEGKVCLPRCVKASAPPFGYSAVQAISQWRFEVPKVGGKPVRVRVKMPFDFVHKAEPEDSR